MTLASRAVLVPKFRSSGVLKNEVPGFLAEPWNSALRTSEPRNLGTPEPTEVLYNMPQ
jgi:hypothetical protein